jgi:hypothetical protein
MTDKKSSESRITKRGGYSGSAPQKPIKVPSTPGASTNPKPQQSGESGGSGGGKK